MNRTLLPSLLLVGLLGSCASTHAPSPGPDLAHTTALDWTCGDWVGTRRSADDGESHALHVRVTPILGGAGQLRQIRVERGGEVYRGMSIQLREAESGQWTRYYANDVHGELVSLRAVGDRSSAPNVWRSGPNASGRWSENRTERPEESTWVSTVSRTKDGGATWEVLFVDRMERVAPRFSADS